MNKTVYLAGPMDFVGKEHRKEWRVNATETFLQHGWDVLDPTKRPHKGELTKKEIFKMDMRDIDRSSLLLVDNREIFQPVFGTTCEVFYMSHILKRPVIGWGISREGVFKSVLFDRFFDEMGEAIDHIVAFYSEF